MNALSQEVRLVQNSALGAMLLWSFAKSYAAHHPTRAPASFPLAALVLPMTWHETTLEYISSTRSGSGLRAMAEKIGSHELDVLLGLHNRSRQWRTKTCGALRMAISTGMLRLALDGALIAAEKDWHPNVPFLRNQKAATEKLGVWFASSNLGEISLTLHVLF